MRLSEAIEGYKITKIADGYSINTMNGYQTHFNQMISYFGDVDISKITNEQLRNFMVWLRREYQPQRFSNDNSPYKSTTMRNAWCAMRSLFRWANDELGTGRPDLDIKMPKVSYPEVIPFTKEEIMALLKACTYTKSVNTPGKKPYRRRRLMGARDRLLILVLLDTGIRVSECAAIRIQDVNPENGELFIRPLNSSRKNKSRTLHIGGATRRALWSYLNKRGKTFPEDLLFLTKHEQPMGANSIRHTLLRISENAGVKHVYPHRFRHTFAIQFLRNGGDVFSLQQALGHSDLAMTRHYSNIAKSDLESAHRRASPVDNWRL